MGSTVRHIGTADPLVGFSHLERRSLAVNTATRQLAVGDEAPGGATGQPLELIAIRYFATTAQYVSGDFVTFNGQIWKAKAGVAPGPFDPSDWVGMTDGGQFVLLDGTRNMYGNLEIDKTGASLVLNALGASQADIWLRRDGLTRWLLRSDELAPVDLHIYRFDDAGFVIDAPLTISRSTGRISILGNPVGALELVPKQYVDGQIAYVSTLANDRVLRAGDTMTGGLVVPVLTIQNSGYSDLYFTEASGAARWLIRGNDPTTANLEFHHYDAGGGYLGAALVLDNASGLATFQNVIRVPGLQFGGNAGVGFYDDATNIALRTHNGNGIYFQSENGGATYGLINAGGLTVYGAITSTAQDGLRVTVPAGYYARTLYTVSGVRAWTAGVYADGRYAIGDESAGAARLIIDLNGKVWFANDANIPGTIDTNTINAATGNIGTVNASAVNTGSLHVTGNSQMDGNLVVNGTLTATGTTTGGTPITQSASGYQMREGTPGPFYMGPWENLDYGPGYSGPYYFNVTPMSQLGNVRAAALWINHKAQYYMPGSAQVLSTAIQDNPDAYAAIKALEEPRAGFKDGRPVNFGQEVVVPLLSENVMHVVLKALKQAMARIEVLENKVRRLTDARSG